MDSLAHKFGCTSHQALRARHWMLFAETQCSDECSTGCVLLQGGRLCIAVPVSADGPPKGILLGSSAGTLYVEPPAAVALNNDLAAARGEVRFVSGLELGFGFRRWRAVRGSACRRGPQQRPGRSAQRARVGALAPACCLRSRPPPWL